MKDSLFSNFLYKIDLFKTPTYLFIDSKKSISSRFSQSFSAVFWIYLISILVV